MARRLQGSIDQIVSGTTLAPSDGKNDSSSRGDFAALDLRRRFDDDLPTGLGRFAIVAAKTSATIALTGGPGPELLVGTAGHDTIFGDKGDDTIRGLGGNDTLSGDEDNDSILGGAGRDSVLGGSGDDRLFGDDGNDTIEGGFGGDTVLGGEGSDSAIGGGDADSILGGDGHDTLDGGSGDDTIDGGVGSDRIFGDKNNDLLRGGAGHDTIEGGSGADTIEGGTGSDRIAGDFFAGKGGSGDDSILGGAGFDTIEGGDGGDTIDGGTAADSLHGGDDNDLVTGGHGHDTIDGGSGDDSLSGGDGHDDMFGSKGDDTLSGGRGDDLLDGGEDRDCAVYMGLFADYSLTVVGDDTIVVDLNHLDGNDGTDTLVSIERIKFADTVIGGDPPVVEIDGDTSYALCEAAVIVDPSIAISDPDGTMLDGATVAVTGGFMAGDALLFTDQSGITGSYDSGTGILTLTGTASFADYETALESISFSATMGTGTRTISFTVTDTDGINSDVDTATVEVTPAVGFDSVIGPADLDGMLGSIVVGDSLPGGALPEFGRAVAGVGDINGDGYEDFLVGAPNFVTNATSGDAYVVFGDAGGLPALLLASTFDGTNGFRLDGIDIGDHTGFAVGGGGDVNGDGFEDFIIGAPHVVLPPSGSTDTGAAYVVFGHGGAWAATLSLAALTGADGFRLDGEVAQDWAGHGVDIVDDLNGDGIDDIAVGAPFADNTSTSSGSAYVVFGSLSPWAATFALSSVDGSNGFRLDGRVFEDDRVGISLSSAGDVNGDGIGDLIVGSLASSPVASGTPGGSLAGSAHVLFGSAGPWAATLNVADLDGNNGFTMYGADIGDEFGLSVSNIGDLNGDSYDDVLVGARLEGPDLGSSSGAAYVVFGQADGWSAVSSPADLDGTNGFAIESGDPGSWLGLSVASAGDFNGDGYADLVVGAPLHNVGMATPGTAYLVFGHGEPWDASLAPETLDGAVGFQFHGAGTILIGYAVGSAGDLNGDGFDDLLIGSPFANTAGSVYVVYGTNANCMNATMGSDDADSIDGSAAMDQLIGAGGDDTLVGGGGADVFQGAEGDDLILVEDFEFFRADGGTGTDRLALLTAGAVDFGDLDGDAATSDRGRIVDIEILDFDNGLANALALGFDDVLDLDVTNSDVGGVASLDNVLQILGDTDDTLALAASDGWGAADTMTLAGFALYSSANVTIAVDTDIVVTVS